jgi:hypothetical protein
MGHLLQSRNLKGDTCRDRTSVCGHRHQSPILLREFHPHQRLVCITGG